ncbi:MAG TPA: hypothetical protein VKU60_19340 [Chloroflexota bacterium]|nr:hypothetical protein [Chloroflexota bacterium]
MVIIQQSEGVRKVGRRGHTVTIACQNDAERLANVLVVVDQKHVTRDNRRTRLARTCRGLDQEIAVGQEIVEGFGVHRGSSMAKVRNHRAEIT